MVEEAVLLIGDEDVPALGARASSATMEDADADDFASRLARRVAARPVGEPTLDGVLGSVVGMQTVLRVERLITDAVARGAKVLAGCQNRGTIMPGYGVDHVTADMGLFNEGAFGPQVSITRVRTDEEAVRLANHSTYGLGGSSVQP
jgi:acyl-CoA reductase-like NAD-dependent aldehyde dehydrogenase